jgi:hypothetical protein
MEARSRLAVVLRSLRDAVRVHAALHGLRSVLPATRRVACRHCDV